MTSHFLIVLTKLGILKWKKREYIEKLIFDGDLKYISYLYGKEFKLKETRFVFPYSCYLEISSSGITQFRSKNMLDLLYFLDKQNLKIFIPENIIKDPNSWINKKNALKIIRRIKIEEIDENCRMSERWASRY